MTAATDAIDPARRCTLRVAIGAILFAGASVGVWFLGFDGFWAVATLLVITPVVAVLATLALEEEQKWEQPVRETPRGVRITLAILSDSLAACDRLARPALMRRIRALIVAERDDRLSRSMLMRRMRKLLVEELHRGLDSADHDSIDTLRDRDVTAILEPDESNPASAATIERCLDAIERNVTNSTGIQ